MRSRLLVVCDHSMMLLRVYDRVIHPSLQALLLVKQFSAIYEMRDDHCVIRRVIRQASFGGRR